MVETIMTVTRNRSLNRNTKWKKMDCLTVCTWNLQSFNTSEKKIILDLKHRTYLCAIQETKEKGREQWWHGDYVVTYSDMNKETRARKGIRRVLLLNPHLHISAISVISAYSP